MFEQDTLSVRTCDGFQPADLDLLMQTASSDVSTAALAGDLDECSFKTAGSADFDQHQKLAHLDDFLHTAASELSTGAQRTDSVLTGLAELSISDYSAPASETFLDDVEAELYPQGEHLFYFGTPRIDQLQYRCTIASCSQRKNSEVDPIIF